MQCRLFITCLSQNQGQTAPLLFSCSLSRLPLSPFGAAFSTGRLGKNFAQKLGYLNLFKIHFFPERMLSQQGKPICFDENSLYLPGSSRMRTECPAPVDILGLMSLSSCWLLHVWCKAGSWGQGPPHPPVYPNSCSSAAKKHRRALGSSLIWRLKITQRCLEK